MFFSTSMALAQSGATVGTIAGTVKDSQGGVLVGATITVKQKETSIKRSTQVDETGVYILPQLPPGSY